MIKALILIFKHDIKGVRPLRLFSPHIRFCASLWESGSEPFDGTVNQEKLKTERRAFLDKLVESGAGSLDKLSADLCWTNSI